jgi:hypothetical protein
MEAVPNIPAYFKVEIASAAGSWTSDNDVVNEVNLEKPAGFVDAAGKAQIRL